MVDGRHINLGKILIFISNGIALKNGTGFKLIYFILSIIFFKFGKSKNKLLLYSYS
jgi:hypothetical protein